ncbi:MAG: glutathione S-transferase family protein [Pseudomonadota bacterium]
MRLYDGGRALNPRRVRIFLAEKGIDVPKVDIDVMAGDQRSPEIVALNPMMRVPILVLDDGTVISESIAICRYFEEIQPDPPLMGRDPVDKARVEMWNRQMELDLGYAILAVARHGHPALKPIEPIQLADWSDLNRKKIPDLLAFLDRELANKEFIAGDAYTIADITALCMLDFMKITKIPVPDHHTNLLRWRKSVSERPSARA